jgi:predicted lipoprotein with Yx(FWY)xxD motif
MVRKLSRSAPVLVDALAGGCASTAPSAPAKAVDGVFVVANGMTLYTFDGDVASSGKSVCNDPCATNGPPLTSGADAQADGAWSIVTRDDGSKQWALKGMPEYQWAKDTNPGDRTGDGVNSVWPLARS